MAIRDERTLKSGIPARLEVFRMPLLACHVLKVYRNVHGLRATVRITRGRGAYKAGEELDVYARYVIPRGCVRRRTHATHILPFDIQVDEPSALAA